MFQNIHLTAVAAILLATLAAMPALGIDATRPARVQLVVTDEEGRVLPGARVRLSRRWTGWPDKPDAAIERTTDAAGTVHVERLRPDNALGISWFENVRVDVDGHLPREHNLQLFPGAEQDVTLRLDRERTTLIRLRGPQGEPLPRVALRVSYSQHGHSQIDLLFTDDNGECRWRHGRLDRGFSISDLSDPSWGWGRPRLRDEPVITITYDEESLPFSARLLTGKLLHADGSAATGWLVARRANVIDGWGSTHGPMYDNVRVEKLTRVGPDGRFEADIDAEGRLVVVSPEGIPLLYALNPQNWPPGDRHVTLRLPDVRREHHGVVVEENGKPVAGLPIELRAVRWDGRNWSFTTSGDVGQPRGRLSRATAADGSPIGTVQTDSQGRYAVPIYFGSTAEFQVHREGWRFLDRLGTEARSVWKRYRDRGRKLDLENIKHVTLVFENEQGEHIPSITVNIGLQLHDSRGVHLFLDRSRDRVELETRDSQGKWLPLKTTVELAGTDEQVVRVTLEEAQRLQPLSGLVLDPEGQPVPKATVSLLSPDSEQDPLGNPHLGINTVTDERGEFSFDAAPDDCRIKVRRDNQIGADDLPGWTTPQTVNRRTRDVTIRLKRVGTVKALLPAGMGDTVEGIFLEREGVPPDWRENVFVFTHDADRNELLSEVLRPGRYVLSVGDYASELTEPFAALGVVRAEVKAGEQTVVDLRDLKLPDRLVARERPRAWNTVVVKHAGQVVSGADVTVYAAAARPDDLARWTRQWTSGDAGVRKGAITLLQNAGALAVDAIRNAGEELDRDRLLKDLGELEYDGLHRLARDLTDDTGTVRCEIEDGRHCVAVTRVRGRLIGRQPFVAGGDTVTVDLRPARTLVIRLKHAEIEGQRHGSAEIMLEQPSAVATRALMSALYRQYGHELPDHGGWLPRKAIFDHQYPMQSDGKAAWVMEDLPTGAVCTVIWHKPFMEDDDQPRRTGRITIEPGDGVQVVEW